MLNDFSEDNSQVLTLELGWLEQVTASRLEAHAQNNHEVDVLLLAPPPVLKGQSGPYADFLLEHDCSPSDRLLLILALAPNIAPSLFDPFLITNQAINWRFTEFGGELSDHDSGFLPTLQTAIFLLAGADIPRRLEYLGLLKASPLMGAADALLLDADFGDNNALLQPLAVTPEARERLFWGRIYTPTFSSDFPAELLQTAYEWEDLVLSEDVQKEIDHVLAWIRNKEILLDTWQLRRRLAPGYRALFAGPLGTGKTLTACLLGKVTGRSVFRVDVSKVISKHIGKTEKNLARLFDRAHNRDWILFFDEAGALFSKRGEGSFASDRAANQNVSYILQRIESFAGVVILASNSSGNIDDAFSRRFQSVVNFRMPDSDERLRLWRDNFTDAPFDLAENVDLAQLAYEYEISGGQIVNVLRYACMKAVQREDQTVLLQDIISGIRKEVT